MASHEPTRGLPAQVALTSSFLPPGPLTPVTTTRSESAYLASAAILAWGGIVLQLIVSTGLVGSAIGAAWQLVGYFTILTNFITATFFTFRLVRPAGRAADWFQRQSVAGWVTLSITFVGIAFGVLLAQLFHPRGMGAIANDLLHYVTPAVCLGYWLAFVRKGGLEWRHAGIWTTYIAAYGAYAFIRGAATGFYPYPFIDLPHIGMSKTIVNTIGLLLAFWLGGVLLVLIDKRSAVGTRTQVV